MTEAQVINSREMNPMRYERTPLSPHGVLEHYIDVGTTTSYYSRPGQNCWRGIVTDYTPAFEDGGPIKFILAGGLSKNHQPIAEALGTTEKAFRLGNSTAQLRLESEEDSLQLCAELMYHNGEPVQSDLQIAASLLQAANQAPNPFDKSYNQLIIKTFWRNQRMVFEVVTDDSTDALTAIPYNL